VSHTVLICDDAIFMRTMVGDILQQAGFEIVGEAETGVQAVEKYKQLRPDLPAELGGDDHPIAPPLQRAAEELLVRERSVHLGGVEERYSELDGALDGGYGLPFIGGAVGLAHPHAAESELGNFEARTAEPACA
jgi:hypothetical protein